MAISLEHREHDLTHFSDVPIQPKVFKHVPRSPLGPAAELSRSRYHHLSDTRETAANEAAEMV